MRVGLIAPPWIPVPPPTYGGTEAVLDTLARGLANAGHEVVLFTTGDATCPVERRSYWRTGVEPMGSIIPEVAHVRAAYDTLAGCDVIHDHTLLGPVLCHPDVPVVTTVHGPFTPEIVTLLRGRAEGVAVVAISHAHAAAAPGDVPVARVIHHGITAADIPVGHGAGGYAMFLGRMAPEKGVHVACAVARAAGVPLRIAAKMREPDEVGYFESVVRPLLGGGVEYLGEVSARERYDLLGGALALLNPIDWPEPFGMVMIEALACGTPVVARPFGAAPEIVEPGVTGYLASDPAHLAEALHRAAGLDRGACRKAAETDFSAQRMTADHVALYRDLSG